MEKTEVGIIGLGRIGTAMGRLLAAHEERFHIRYYFDLSLEKMNRFSHLTGVVSRRNRSELRHCDMVLLTVPDAEIRREARFISDNSQIKKGAIVCHCSGVLGLSCLNAVRRVRASRAVMHPLISVPEPGESPFLFDKVIFGYLADPESESMICHIIDTLNGVPVRLKENGKAMYHAAAVIAGNFPYVLMAWALSLMTAAGMPPEIAHDAVWKLMKSTLDNTAVKLSPDSISGPAVRGDKETILHHLGALKERGADDAELYRLLSISLLSYMSDMAGADKNVHAMQMLAKWLKEGLF